MRVGRVLIPYLLTVLSSLVVPHVLFACSCIDQSLNEAFAQSPFIFVGKVVRLEVVGTENGVDTIEATVIPSEVFKGNPAASIKFLTDNGCCYCSYEFEIAKEYLLFASEHDGYFRTGACSRSALVVAAKDDLEVLRAEAQQQ